MRSDDGGWRRAIQNSEFLFGLFVLLRIEGIIPHNTDSNCLLSHEYQ